MYVKTLFLLSSRWLLLELNMIFPEQDFLREITTAKKHLQHFTEWNLIVSV